jgi:hypothetical protein
VDEVLGVDEVLVEPGVASASAAEATPSVTTIVSGSTPSLVTFSNRILLAEGPAGAGQAPAGSTQLEAPGRTESRSAWSVPQLLDCVCPPLWSVLALLPAPLNAPLTANWLALPEPVEMPPALMFTGTLALTTVWLAFAHDEAN